MRSKTPVTAMPTRRKGSSDEPDDGVEDEREQGERPAEDEEDAEEEEFDHEWRSFRRGAVRAAAKRIRRWGGKVPWVRGDGWSGWWRWTGRGTGARRGSGGRFGRGSGRTWTHVKIGMGHQAGAVTLESGRTRAEVAEWLIGMARETPRMVVGCRFLLQLSGSGLCGEMGRGWRRSSGSLWPGAWRAVAGGGVRGWAVLGAGGRGRTGKKPAEFCGERRPDAAADGYAMQDAGMIPEP